MAYRHTAISSFPRAVLATTVPGLTFLPMARFSVFTLQLLLLLIPSGSLIGCQLVQVYCHHLSFHIMTHHGMQTIKILLLVSVDKIPRVARALTSPVLTLCAVSSFVSEGANPSSMF
jgi:hypothetical protein